MYYDHFHPILISSHSSQAKLVSLAHAGVVQVDLTVESSDEDGPLQFDDDTFAAQIVTHLQALAASDLKPCAPGSKIEVPMQVQVSSFGTLFT